MVFTRLPMCEIHGRLLDCAACRAAKAGRVSSPAKTAANRKKAKQAAMKRWHPEKFKGTEKRMTRDGKIVVGKGK